jgi:hypothetical protein
MPIANSDRVPDEFMPGIRSGVPNLAPGSPPASGRAADDELAGPVTLQGIGAWQPGTRYAASTGGTVMPGQVDASDISPGPESDFSDTGAGSGRASHYPRRSWQQGAS